MVPQLFCVRDTGIAYSSPVWDPLTWAAGGASLELGVSCAFDTTGHRFGSLAPPLLSKLPALLREKIVCIFSKLLFNCSEARFPRVCPLPISN